MVVSFYKAIFHFVDSDIITGSRSCRLFLFTRILVIGDYSKRSRYVWIVIESMRNENHLSYEKDNGLILALVYKL